MRGGEGRSDDLFLREIVSISLKNIYNIIDSKYDTARRGDGRGTGRGEGFKEPHHRDLKNTYHRHLNECVVSIV